MQDVDRPCHVQALPEPARACRPRVEAKPLRVVPRPEGLDRIGGHRGRMLPGVRSSHSHGQSDDRARVMMSGAGRSHGPIPEERREDAGQAGGEREDGDVRAAAGRPPWKRRPSNARSRGRGLRCCDELLALAVEGDQRLLDQVHFTGFEQWFAALFADPGWDGIPVDVIAATLHVEGGDTSLHPTLAMDALH